MTKKVELIIAKNINIMVVILKKTIIIEKLAIKKKISKAKKNIKKNGQLSSQKTLNYYGIVINAKTQSYSSSYK